MKISIKTAIALCLTLLLANHSQAQKINVDAVSAYWELTIQLKKNIPLTDAQWNKFIAMDGNSTYAASEFTPDRLAKYRNAIELVYMPENDSLLNVRLKENNWFCILAKRYKDEELELKQYLEEKITAKGYFNQAYQYVYEYLPKKSQHPVKGLNLYYNCLSNDAVSYSTGLYFSLLSVIDNSKIKTGTLEAHELHHRLRNNIDFDSTKVNIAGAEGLLWAINSIPNEGIADMIDKPAAFAQSGDPMGIKDWLIDRAPVTLQSLDSCMRVMAENKVTSVLNTKFFRNLVKGTAGHMPGFYMARIIVKEGYKKQMVDHSENPFNFFYLYNKAAKKAPEHPFIFSEESILYLKALKNKISIKTKA